MTPFASMEKSAYQAPPQGWGYQRNAASGLNDPFSGYRPNKGTEAYKQQNPRHWGWDAGEIGADIALGSNPFTGVPWFGGKMINDFAHGRWGSGLMNAGFGALSFLPGAGSAAAVGAKGATGLAKFAPGIAKGLSHVQTGAKLGKGTKWGLGIGGGATAATGMGMDVFGSGPVDPTNPYARPWNPGAPQSGSGGGMPVHEYMARSMVANKPV